MMFVVEEGSELDRCNRIEGVFSQNYL